MSNDTEERFYVDHNQGYAKPCVVDTDACDVDCSGIVAEDLTAQEASTICATLNHMHDFLGYEMTHGARDQPDSED